MGRVFGADPHFARELVDVSTSDFVIHSVSRVDKSIDGDLRKDEVFVLKPSVKYNLLHKVQPLSQVEAHVDFRSFRLVVYLIIVSWGRMVNSLSSSIECALLTLHGVFSSLLSSPALPIRQLDDVVIDTMRLRCDAVKCDMHPLQLAQLGVPGNK